MNTCQHCSASYKPNTGRGARPSRFCSRKCQSRSLYLRKQAESGVVRAQRNCEWCDGPIPDVMRSDARNCSAKCRERSHNKRMGPTVRLQLWGLTLDTYESMLAAQGGSCAVPGCDIAVNDNGRRLHVDHDHGCCPGRTSCGECIRGLLCANHNVGIGMFNDDPDALRAAAEYLEAWRAVRRIA